MSGQAMRVALGALGSPLARTPKDSAGRRTVWPRLHLGPKPGYDANMQKHGNLRQRSLLVSAKAVDIGLTQEQIAKELGISQSQVSRILSGKSRRASRVYLRICEYVEKASAPHQRTGPITPALAEALTGVWDGTTEHAELLATLLNTLSALAAYQKGRRQHST